MIDQLAQDRLVVAAQLIGGMERAGDETVAYTKSREAFGHSLFDSTGATATCART